MVVENQEVLVEAVKGYLALTLEMMGKSRYELRQALIIANEILQEDTVIDMICYYRNLKFKD